MEFSPSDPIVRLCMQGMQMEDAGKADEARRIFLQAWNESVHDLQKFLAAHFLSRHQDSVTDKIKWIETAINFAARTDSHSVKGAFPSLYSNLSNCYAELNDQENAKKFRDLALSYAERPTDTGPFYHGTKADLKTGDLLTPGGVSNYKPELIMNHIYFTALVNGAGLAAALSKGEGKERVYIVQPTGHFENDPNVTDKKFPGNPTRSYRTSSPLKIVGEVKDWVRITTEELQKWRERLANNKGEIIN